MEQLRTNEKQIKELADKITANAKDPHWAKSQVEELLRLQRQDCEMNKLIDVPLKDVKDTIDFGACAIHRCKDGYVFVAKGGMETHVSWRMSAVCAMLDTLFETHNKEGKDEDENTIYEALSTAVQYVFQAPIFSSLNEKALFDNATALLRSFHEYCDVNYTNAEAVEETEKDIKDNIEAERLAQAAEAIADAPLPPED